MIAAEALAAHVAALQERLAEIGSWRSADSVDTEVLRAAMQSYRSFVAQVLGA